MPRKGSGKLTGAALKAAEQKWFFPLRLQGYLTVLGWSQQDLAELSGLLVSEINKVLNGRRDLRIDPAARVIGAFEFSRAIQLDLLFALLPWDIARLPQTASWYRDFDSAAEVLGADYSANDWLRIAPQWFRLLMPRVPGHEIGGADNWRREFRRLVQLFANGFFVNPDTTRYKEALDAYVDRVLRPAARRHPRAAWTLARWLGPTERSGGNPRAELWGRWHVYRRVRRGRWLAVWGERRPIQGGRITRPRKHRGVGRLELGRPLGDEEHIDIIQWARIRDWEFNGEDAGLDDEVLAIASEAKKSAMLAEELDRTLWQAKRGGR